MPIAMPAAWRVDTPRAKNHPWPSAPSQLPRELARARKRKSVAPILVAEGVAADDDGLVQPGHASRGQRSAA